MYVYSSLCVIVVGLRVDSELLASCAGALEFINHLLRERKVRAVRTTNNHLRGKLKCLRLGEPTQTPMDAASFKNASIIGTIPGFRV